MIQLKYPKFWDRRGILSTLFMPFSFLYIFLGYLRRLAAKPVRLPGFVICVGNMTVGGTGKTQFTQYLAKKLQVNNHKLLIVTKGYGSKLKGAKLVTKTDLALDVGDESKLLSEYGQVLAARSIKAAIPLISKLDPDIIIFDDGMQNPSFIKDLTILVVDPIRAIGNGRIFPSGPLREKATPAISRSDIVIFVGDDPCTNFSLVQAIISSQKPFFKSKIQIESHIEKDKKYYAFAAIGNPQRFFRLLAESGANLVMTKSFPDHHNYSPAEINELIQEAEHRNCKLITTKKDYVKISNTKYIECADATLSFDQENELLELINEKIKAHI
ncbi:MAG: tetraacyldisaccharide 4'-kinase [Rickettsiaceae bacterium]